MKKDPYKYAAIIAVIILAISVFWISRSCEHKTVETPGYDVIEEAKKAKELEIQKGEDSVKKYDHEYQGNLHKYNHPDSIGREEFSARLRKAVSDSLRKRALR